MSEQELQDLAVRESADSFADRFLDAVVDKGTLWLLIAVGVLAAVVGVAQIVIAQGAGS